MKKILLLSVLLLIGFEASAQTQFSVPTRTMEQKRNNARGFMYNYIISSINVAKSDGMTVEEFGKKSGEVFIPWWDENTGFEQIVNYMLGYWANFSDNVQIIEQSNEKVVITVPHIYPYFENQGTLVGVSLEELITFLNVAHRTLFNHFDVGFDLTWGEEGLKTVITK